MTDEDRRRDVLRRMMESQAYREIMAVNLVGHSLKFVPDAATKTACIHDLEEELEHFEAVASLYEAEGHGDVMDAIQDRLDRVPYPESWLELAMAQFLYDRAGGQHLEEYTECTWEPYAGIVGKILAEEEEHESFGEETLLEMSKSNPDFQDAAQPLFEKWLRVGCLSFGRPGTPDSDFAVAEGLKKHDPAEVIQAFIDDIRPTVAACGLAFPERLEDIGIEAGETVTL